MSELTIRAATKTDHADILDVSRSANEARRSGRTVSLDHVKRIRNHLSNPSAICFVAVLDEAIVGYTLAVPGRTGDGSGAVIDDLCHIAAVFVRPEYWGRRIGAGLVIAIIDAARERGFDRAQLWTHADNQRAQRLYERYQFARTGRSKDDDEGEYIVLYARSLLKIT